MVKHMKHKFGIFGLTWLLGPEGSPDEETRTNSCSIIFFFEEVEGFVRMASGAATSVAFSYESAISSRASSWGWTQYWSWSPGHIDVPSEEDLKQILVSKQSNGFKASSQDV
jgi:hypothetical protein